MNKKQYSLLDRIYKGDCAVVLKQFPDDYFDLVFTSPPYADNRPKSRYKGVETKHYVDWFAPIATEIHRVLKPHGSFILNIKERAINGERQTYVLELILKLRQNGWYWIEEYIWYKKNCYPGKWPNRFRDAWERCLHFTKNKDFLMYQEAVMVPMGGWKNKRLSSMGSNDFIRHESSVASGLGKNISNWIGRELAYPTNVIQLPTVCSNKNHCATFPLELPGWFIRLLTADNNIVLDPFIGSGTTALACIQLNRHFVGIEIEEHNHNLANQLVLDELKKKAINIR